MNTNDKRAKVAAAQAAGQYGIETLKLFFSTGLSALLKLLEADTNKDKKISTTEIFMAVMGLGGSIMQIAPLWSQVKLEGGEIDRAERNEIAQFIIDFKLMPGSTRPEIEEQIDDSVYIVNQIISFYERTRDRFPRNRA